MNRADLDAIYDALADWVPADQPTGEQIDVIVAAYDARRGRSVLVVGNPVDGLPLIGAVHPDDPDMLRFAEDHGSDWWLLPLTRSPTRSLGARRTDPALAHAAGGAPGAVTALRSGAVCSAGGRAGQAPPQAPGPSPAG
ncbi:MAG: hypothetical protein AB7H43_15150 [Acidimicrobiia bacterium]